MPEKLASARLYIEDAAQKGYFDESMMRFLNIENSAFNIVLFIYLTSAILYFLHVLFPQSRAGKLSGKFATFLIYAGLIIQTFFIGWRTVLSNRGPFQGLYEAIMWFVLMIGIVHLYVENRLKLKMSGVLIALMMYFSMRFGMSRDPYIGPWFPPNQSHWFIIHVACAFTSYAVFMVGFATEISYVIMAKINALKHGLSYGFTDETLPYVREMVWKLIRFGFPLLTFTIFGGAVWANDTWGRYWSWDPKEVWAAITWIFFALYIHAMAHPRWRGARASVIVIVGFIAMMITFIGISFLVKLFNLESFHAYAL